MPLCGVLSSQESLALTFDSTRILNKSALSFSTMPQALLLLLLLCLPVFAQTGRVVGISEKNRVYFRTRQDAERAGFRRAKNC